MEQDRDSENKQPTGQSDYERRRAARVERLRNRAARLRSDSVKSYEQAHDIGKDIPFGQPILVGHHSERRHRRAIERIDNAMRKSVELSQAANDAARAADAAEANTAISSDDPRAVEKLQAELDEMEQRRTRMKAANKLIAKDDVEGLKALGFADGKISKLLNPMPPYRKGFQRFEFANLSANIRRVKGRIKQLQRTPSEARRVEIVGDSFRAFEDQAENRVCFKFDGKPEESIRDVLKRNGFKWSPTRGAWVRMLNDAGRYAARQVAEQLTRVTK